MDTIYLSPTSDSTQKPQGSGVEKVSDVLKSRGSEWNVGLLRTLISRDEWHAVFEIPISSTPKKDGYTNLAFLGSVA
ncbi:hypothetical protein RHMOL_Rhmol08G0135200 [Rhododendron molle]|uniref:Uncharacterized protein n=1 Tax=Rhododendron molle TaxID=49168 RepID=A0ACC0MP51_RHOML|nr:hypothetical protein RHMOL_Rhmol08G0135200 [Rhododendron molle]